MKTPILSLLALTAGFAAVSANGQSPAPVVTPSSPAPAVASSLVPNQVVYAQTLPTAAELSNAAAAQGLTIERIEQTPAQVLVLFKYGNGQSTTVSYQLVPPAGAVATPVMTPVAVEQPAVVYRRAPRVVYYDDYYPYWYPPVSLSLGVGFGHFHGGGRWGGRGRW